MKKQKGRKTLLKMSDCFCFIQTRICRWLVTVIPWSIYLGCLSGNGLSAITVCIKQRPKEWCKLPAKCFRNRRNHVTKPRTNSLLGQWTIRSYIFSTALTSLLFSLKWCTLKTKIALLLGLGVRDRWNLVWPKKTTWIHLEIFKLKLLDIYNAF